MTERTYGKGKSTLYEIERIGPGLEHSAYYDMAAHIRELQAEVAESNRLLQIACQEHAQFEEENVRLKEEWRGTPP